LLNQTKLNISRKKRAKKFYQRGYIVILNYLCNAIKKTLAEISLHRHFNEANDGNICVTPQMRMVLLKREEVLTISGY
jgi:hypothetical protein